MLELKIIVTVTSDLTKRYVYNYQQYVLYVLYSASWKDKTVYFIRYKRAFMSKCSIHVRCMNVPSHSEFKMSRKI
jgi:hypothetical protein